jgi:Fe-S oxidoreductase
MVSTLAFALLCIASFAGIAINLRRLIATVRLGKPENRTDRLGARFVQTFRIAFAQTKLMRDPVPGLMHLGIYWGFLALLLAVVESIIEGFIPHFSFSFLGWFYSVMTITQDLFCVIVAASVFVAWYRRSIKRVPRLQVDSEHLLDANLILSLIFIIVVSYLFQNAAGHACGLEARNAVRPFSAILSSIAFGDNSFAAGAYTIFWWIHIFTVLGFMNYLPYSKHLHVITSVPNVFFSSLGKPVRLRTINFEEEGLETFGVADVEHFSWKQLLDAYTCTECSRCTTVCPANSTGKELNPKLIITAVRDRLVEKAPVLLNTPGAALAEPEKRFVGDYETDDALWACTTCGACMEECPVTIEHVPAIIDMRRSLVMMESRFPEELQVTFRNLENNFAPWAFSPGERADWAAGTGVVTLAENAAEYDVLFWVGCAGSYDARAKSVTVAFATLMHQAGVRFRILGTEEKCTGDPARRGGNEYLAQMLMKENVETLNRYEVKRIVTTCPHCFNTLKNEYPEFGGTYAVEHHTTFLQRLLDEGKITPSSPLMHDVTFHDPCYLGRHNDTYDAPRDDLRRIPGVHLAEMPRAKDKSFCCGAGGARMFMEETGTRVNEVRTQEAVATGATIIAAACPFCMTMLTDGVKSIDKAETVAVKDIAELLLESVNAPAT